MSQLHALSTVVSTDPQVMHGTPVFAGTRVPIEALWNNINSGLSLDEFLDVFPSVTRAQALAVLRCGEERVMQLLQPAQ